MQNNMLKQLGFMDEDDQKKLDEDNSNQHQNAVERALKNIIPVGQKFAPLGPIFSNLNEWPSSAILRDTQNAQKKMGLGNRLKNGERQLVCCMRFEKISESYSPDQQYDFLIQHDIYRRHLEQLDANLEANLKAILGHLADSLEATWSQPS